MTSLIRAIDAVDKYCRAAEHLARKRTEDGKGLSAALLQDDIDALRSAISYLAMQLPLRASDAKQARAHPPATGCVVSDTTTN